MCGFSCSFLIGFCCVLSFCRNYGYIFFYSFFLFLAKQRNYPTFLPEVQPQHNSTTVLVSTISVDCLTWCSVCFVCIVVFFFSSSLLHILCDVCYDSLHCNHVIHSSCESNKYIRVRHCSHSIHTKIIVIHSKMFTDSLVGPYSLSSIVFGCVCVCVCVYWVSVCLCVC